MDQIESKEWRIKFNNPENYSIVLEIIIQLCRCTP